MSNSAGNIQLHAIYECNVIEKRSLSGEHVHKLYRLSATIDRRAVFCCIGSAKVFIVLDSPTKNTHLELDATS